MTHYTSFCEVQTVSEVNFARSRQAGSDATSQPPQHTLTVCITCAKSMQGKDSSEPSGGERLLDQLSHYPDWQLRDRFRLQPAKCMGVCSRECAIALTCAGKITYLFGDLPTDPARLVATTAAVLECANQYHDKPDGVLSYRDRPELFKTGLVARIPL
jgi:predicted metal-binding protein